MTKHEPDCALATGFGLCTCGKETHPKPTAAPGEMDFALREMRAFVLQSPNTALAHIYNTVLAHIAAQAQRLAEMETEAATFSRAYGLVVAQRDAAEARLAARDAADAELAEMLERTAEKAKEMGK